MVSVLSNRSKTPYQNIKNKKDLYTYVEDGLNLVLNFYKNHPALVAEIKYIAKISWHRSSNCMRKLKEGSQQSYLIFRLVHTDAAWTGFCYGKSYAAL